MNERAFKILEILTNNFKYYVVNRTCGRYRYIRVESGNGYTWSIFLRKIKNKIGIQNYQDEQPHIFNNQKQAKKYIELYENGDIDELKKFVESLPLAQV